MNFNSQKKLTFFIFQICLCFAIYGQDKCKSINLKDIEADYQIGKFESVENSLRSCLENGNVTYTIKKEGYRLLAMNSIAMDLMGRAEQDVRELLKIDRNYTKNSDDPIVFLRLIERLRIGGARMVTSVSKIAENLNEAPAIIKIVTREEIKERGYMDLEQVFHDLPGFDISKTGGVTYSSIYQRGYRTNNNNDRSLFLIDGIEDNDLWTNAIYISRQYPMSNIKQFDVIHGPSSTMYGANAFAGVTNITTLLPEDIIPSTSESVGITGFYQRGSYNTQTADVTVAFRKNKLSGTVTGRFFSSDEFDRSGFDDFDYQYSPADVSEYQNLRMEIDATVVDNAETQRFVTIGPDYAQYTPDGAALARDLDIQGFTTDESKQDIKYSNKSLNKFILAKLMFGSLTFGYQYWNNDEGMAWFNDKVYAGTNNGTRWNPTQNLYYLKSDNNISDKWNITNLALYKKQELGENTRITYAPISYLSRGTSSNTNGLGNGYRDLLVEEIPEWRRLQFNLSSWQLRNELKATYVNADFNLVSGLEARYSEIQENYVFNQSEINASQRDIQAGTIRKTTDIGFYSQGNYTKNDLKLVLGGRVDYNKIGDDGGYGTVFNPRVAFVYSPKKWVFKGIYSEAFKDATIFDKYSVVAGTRDVPAPNLRPEKVKNTEVSVSWDNALTKQEGLKLFIEASAHFTSYSGVVATLENSNGSLQNQDGGALEIIGGQLHSVITFNKNIKLDFNYTYTSPYSIPTDNAMNSSNKIRIADIATHKGNIILNWKFKPMTNLKEYHFNWNNRINISGERRMGLGTTTELTNSSGDNLQPISQVAPFSVWTSYFSYSNKFGLTFGLGVHNVLDTLWEVPGARTQVNQYATIIPQPGRNYFLNLRYDLK
jgi:outer membrane receptor for ferrienterochelin and colicins